MKTRVFWMFCVGTMRWCWTTCLLFLLAGWGSPAARDARNIRQTWLKLRSWTRERNGTVFRLLLGEVVYAAAISRNDCITQLRRSTTRFVQEAIAGVLGLAWRTPLMLSLDTRLSIGLSDISEGMG